MQAGKKIAVIAGDGIGKEVTEQAVRVLDSLSEKFGVPFNVDLLPYGSDYYLETGIALPHELRLQIGRDYDAVLLGAVGDPRIEDNVTGREIVLGLRVDLDLYMNVRPVNLVDERVTPLKGKRIEDIQFTIVRENTEGCYGGLGGQQHPDSNHEVATATMIATSRGVERVIRGAFEFAKRNGKQRLCLVHKANAIPQFFLLWLRHLKAIAKEYPEIQASDMLVDRAAMEIIRAPEQFDVLVTSNLLGDILSDLAAMVGGGLGLAASANIHPGKIGLFEPVHGSAPDIAGQGKANPLAMVMSLALMLRHLGYERLALTVEAAVTEAVRSRNTTHDLDGSLSTKEVGDFLISWIEKNARVASNAA
jgi:3-isopropylmalate dehydrogenase